jgi:RNA 2'-O-ribose methyltransferase-like protein/SpoU rRNA methylase family protein
VEVEGAVSDDRVWGRNPVRALLRGDRRRADEIAVLSGAHGPLAELVSLARQAGVKVSYRTREQLTAIAGTPEHQGVVARVAAAEYVDLEDLLAVPAQRGEPPFFLALDQVQDPRNLGALLRTADGFGVHGVIVPKHHSVGLTDAAARTAMGAVEYVSVAWSLRWENSKNQEFGSTARCRRRGRRRGRWIFAVPSAWYSGARERGCDPWSPGPATFYCRSPWPAGSHRSTWVPRARRFATKWPVRGESDLKSP